MGEGGGASDITACFLVKALHSLMSKQLGVKVPDVLYFFNNS